MDSISKDELYNFGCASISITPKHDIPLYTLEGVNRNSRSIHSELLANAVTITYDKEMLIIVSLDLIWVDEEITKKIRSWLNVKYSKFQNHLMLVATHSHSTPQISKKNLNSGRPDLSYLSYLYVQICKVIELALDSTEKCYAELSVTNPGLTVNRRKSILSIESLKHGKLRKVISNRPNYKGVCDSLLHTIWFYNIKGDEKAVILNYACHPTLFRENAVSSDFPGITSNYIKRKIGKKLVVCFLQGFAGNIKANITNSSCSNYKGFFSYMYGCIYDRIQFDKNISNQELNNFSIQLAKFALNRNTCKRLKKQIFFYSKIVNLPLNCDIKSQYPDIEILYLSIGKRLKAVFLSGEVFSEYSIWLRESLFNKDVDLLTVGYCNNMVGYIPTSKEINKGGYEVERSFIEFAHLYPFSDQIEKIIKQNVQNMVNFSKLKHED